MAKKKGKVKKNANVAKKAKPVSRLRYAARIAVAVIVLTLLALCGIGDWYVHHPAEWLAERESFLPAPLV